VFELAIVDAPQSVPLQFASICTLKLFAFAVDFANNPALFAEALNCNVIAEQSTDSANPNFFFWPIPWLSLFGLY
jgi:hypothetical protein